MLAVISGTDSTVAVTSRIAYSRRSAGATRALAPMIAQPASRSTRVSCCAARRDAVAGQALQLVERAAGVAEAAAADHRHHAAAGRDDRRQQQADLVAHAAGGVLVETGPCEAGTRPVEHVAGMRHRLRQRDALGAVHAVQQTAIASAATCPSLQRSPLRRLARPLHEGADLRRVERGAVALGADDFGRREHAGGRALSSHA